MEMHTLSIRTPPSMPQRLIDLISVALATGFGVAYLTPFAKATLASAVTIAIFAGLTWGEPAISPWLIVAIIVIFFVGVAASARVKTEEDPDPSRVVIDEVAGQLAAVVIITNVSWWSMLAAFFLFRLFDITKPLGIRRLEAIPNGWGHHARRPRRRHPSRAHHQRRGPDRRSVHVKPNARIRAPYLNVRPPIGLRCCDM